MTPCPQCQWPHHASKPISVTCAKCGTTVHINGGYGVERKRPALQPQKRNDSRLINWIKWLRRPGEKGVGDTVERLLASIGGRKIKKSLERLGSGCGCTKRQEWLNTHFPYDSEE